MQTQWDAFAKKIMLMQGQNNERTESTDENDDYDDFDEDFPIEVGSYVEDLEWNVRTNLPFKRRLVINH